MSREKFGNMMGSAAALGWKTAFASNEEQRLKYFLYPQIVEPEEVFEKTGLAYLHTTHCLGSGEIMISALGSPEGKAEGTGACSDENNTAWANSWRSLSKITRNRAFVENVHYFFSLGVVRTPAIVDGCLNNPS